MNLDMTGLPGNSVIYHAAVHASHKAHHTDYTHQPNTMALSMMLVRNLLRHKLRQANLTSMSASF